MTLEQLKSFITIAELKSFSYAAKRVNLTQPSISSQIISLEQELGTKLFDRNRKETMLTKSGTILLRYAYMIINLEKEARLAIDDLLDMRRGEIKLGASNIPGSYIVPPLIQKFTHENQYVKIISHVGDSQSIANEVENGIIDLGVIGSRIKRKQLTFYDFIQDTMVLVLNAHHPLAKRSSITVKEFQRLPFIVREEGSGSRKVVEDILNDNGIRVDSLNIVAQLGNTEAIKQGIKLNLGVSILSQCAICDEVVHGLMNYVSIEGLIFKRKFYIIMHKVKSSLPLVNFFKDFLLDYASSEAFRQINKYKN
ncbi:MAG: selenium metabolism-associated LysR family transcriptional regulator [bacterium]